jgi:hypothetical protein
MTLGKNRSRPVISRGKAGSKQQRQRFSTDFVKNGARRTTEPLKKKRLAPPTMNARTVSALVLVAGLSLAASAPLFAASPNEVPTSFTVRTLTASSNGDMKIQRGTDRGDVSFAMKYKTRQELSHDVWAYSGCHTDLAMANDRDCNTVVITFVNDYVANLQLVNKSAVAVIAMNLKANSPTRNLASK